MFQGMHVRVINLQVQWLIFFNDLVNCADESTGATAKSLCTKLLINSVKRDIPAVEASYELSGLPLYRSIHTFQNISLSGFRLLN